MIRAKSFLLSLQHAEKLRLRLGSFALIGDLAPGYFLTTICVLSLAALIAIRRTSADCYV